MVKAANRTVVLWVSIWCVLNLGCAVHRGGSCERSWPTPATCSACGLVHSASQQACDHGSDSGLVECDGMGRACLEIEYGRPVACLDGLGNVLGIPSKLLLWDCRADNHRVSLATVGKVSNYLVENDLTGVKVRVNQYAPGDEFQRLVANKRVGAGWRYTYGLGHWFCYTMFPGRIWGGDTYNPYSNTLSLYSDIPELGIVEAAYARDINQRELPGTYAFVQELPLVGMWHENLATEEALRYVTFCGSKEEIAAAKRVLYARYGIQLGEQVGAFFNGDVAVGGIFPIIGAIGGHVKASLEKG